MEWQGTNKLKKILAGMDIGNSSTEVILMDHSYENPSYIASAMVPTTGVKGTVQNVSGCVRALDEALRNAGLQRQDLHGIRMNQAAPVISDLSMDTVSETVIIGSAMIGHNPDTPGGEGLAMGITCPIDKLHNMPVGSKPVVAVVEDTPFYKAASMLNRALDAGVPVVAVICKQDDGVLIANRLEQILPIVDEVKGIDKIELGIPAAVEVAKKGQTVQTLSNPYGIAGLFKLTPEETKNSIPVARSLTGCRSGVVLRAEGAQVKTGRIPAGRLNLTGTQSDQSLDVNRGAKAIMQGVNHTGTLLDATGEPETNVGRLLQGIKQSMAELTEQNAGDMKINDLLAADTYAAVQVGGGVAGEYAMENVVMLAAMVQTSALPMRRIAMDLENETKIPVTVSGREAEMALKGALTTPGAAVPLAILDLGGGSTDAALITESGKLQAIHHAGAGEMVTRMIDLELNLHDRDLAESIKKYPLAKVESVLFLRFEDGSVKFMAEPLPPELFARIVVVCGETLIPLPRDKRLSMDKVALTRRECKKKVFLTNALRALEAVAPTGEIREIGSVVLVGGSAQDFEIGDILSEFLADFRITAGRANLLGFLPPHSAVALGLALQDKSL